MSQDAARGFGAVAAAYADLRPEYPPALYDFLDTHLTGPRGLCVDLGAGTGKATLDLARRFARVVAIEPDARMLAATPAPANVERRCQAAEAAEFPAGAVDCVTAATSFHWMEQEIVCAQVANWLRPGGAFFPFLYGPFFIEGDGAEIFSKHWTLWAPFRDKRIGRRAIYATPMAACGAFARLEMFSLPMTKAMGPREVAGLFGTASYARSYAEHRGIADVYIDQLTDELSRYREITVGFPLGGVLGVRA